MGTWVNVLINHLHLVIPVIPVSLYKFVSSYVTKTHTRTHTRFCEMWGLSIDVYYFYTEQTLFSIP